MHRYAYVMHANSAARQSLSMMMTYDCECPNRNDTTSANTISHRNVQMCVALHLVDRRRHRCTSAGSLRGSDFAERASTSEPNLCMRADAHLNNSIHYSCHWHNASVGFCEQICNTTLVISEFNGRTALRLALRRRRNDVRSLYCFDATIVRIICNHVRIISESGAVSYNYVKLRVC